MKKLLIGLLALGSVSAIAGECNFSESTGQRFAPKKVKRALVAMGYKETWSNVTIVYESQEQREQHHAELRDSLSVEAWVVIGKGQVVRITRNGNLIAEIEDYKHKSRSKIQDELSASLSTCP
ncbi:MAG: hypothetical protein ACOYL6_15865 [Bacteriovoracaceae bacterium]